MYSVNLTIHNKAFLLPRVLEAIKVNTTGLYELVIVLDGCSDDSEAIVVEFVKNNPLISSKILFTPDVFETKANNTAARNSTGDYILIVQDDMIVNEIGWNERLVSPIKHFSDVFAVTARTAHNWVFNPNNEQLFKTEYVQGQWSDVIFHTDHADRTNTPRNELAIRECVNRGPLALDHSVFRLLGYFDESFSPLDMDDHDLCYRAREIGMRCGCYWIDYISQQEWGGTRVGGKTADWHLYANQKNSRLVYNRHKKQIHSHKDNQNRII